MNVAPTVAFFGHGRAGAHCLRALIGAGLRVLDVSTRSAPEATSDRGSVYAVSQSLGLPTRRVSAPRDPSFVASIRALRPDYIVSVQYDRILPAEVLSAASVAALNLHFGPLPRLRGCFPTKWAIINDEPAGATLHFMDPGIDTGAIVDQETVPLLPDDTDATVYARVVDAGIRVFDRCVGTLARREIPVAVPQDERAASYHPKQQPHQRIISWTEEAVLVERFIRAFTFPPHPGARSWHHGTEYQFRGPLEVDTATHGPPGFFAWAGGSVRVFAASGSLIVPRIWGDEGVIEGEALRERLGDGGSFVTTPNAA